MGDEEPRKKSRSIDYNAIAGTSRERIAGISDGVFGVALTLLILEIHTPEANAIHSEQDLWNALVHLSPHFMTWVMSFMTLGIFWVGQQTQLNHLERSDRSLTWIHLSFLLAVSMIPFSTSLLANFPTYRNAILVYWLNILALGFTLYVSWVCAIGSGLVKAETPLTVPGAIKRRILIAQSLYAGAAAVSFVDTRWSIAFIVLVQLNYVFAVVVPRPRAEA